MAVDHVARRVGLYLASPRLADAGFRHGFALRTVGADAPRLAELVGVATPVYQVRQVHGGRAVAATGSLEDVARIEADAVVSAEATRPVGVRVADCVPVLVGDTGTGVVAAIHAGWRGVVAGVVAAALDAVRARGGAMAGRAMAAIGPSIGACCFEVGCDVADAIAAACGDRAVVRLATAAAGSDKAMVDLRRAVRAQLRTAGLADVDIDDVPGCTRCDTTAFYSYRREPGEGRQLAVIAPRA
jgi:YfiH family protein